MWINVTEKRTESKLFWKHTLRHMFHSIGTRYALNRSSVFKRLALYATNAWIIFWSRYVFPLPSLILVCGFLWKKRMLLSFMRVFFSVHQLTSDHLIIFREKYFPDKKYWPEKVDLGVSGEWKYQHPNNPSCGWKVSPKAILLSYLGETWTSASVRDGTHWCNFIWRIASKQFNVPVLTLKGPITYYLRGSESYCIDSNARIKSFRLIPKLVNQVVPLVVISKDLGSVQITTLTV